MPTRISVPSDGRVAGTPTPRKESVASVMIAVAIWMVAITSTGPVTLGSTWASMIASGRRPLAILLAHVLPNVMGPVLVIGTIHIATAIITEATLSFLGVGVPATRPSLGTLIRIGNEFLYSGEWWITLFPGIALVVLVLSVNLLGDWLRDALNPKLR